MTRIYLDYHATSPLRPEAAAAQRAGDKLLGNPSSVHGEGRAAFAALDEARARIARHFAAPPDAVIFTSGGTEACNLALQQRRAPGGPLRRLIVAASEHVAVLDAARAFAARDGLALHWLAVTPQGEVELERLADFLRDPAPALVAVMAVNNETGVVQPSAEIRALVAAHGSLLFTDAVQAASRVPLELERDGDLMALSAHKFGGPKGIGALLGRAAALSAPSSHGGAQEAHRRAGTQNLGGALGMAAALDAAMADAAQLVPKQKAWQRSMEAWLKKHHPDICIFGESQPRSGSCACFAAAGLSAETLVIALDLAGFAVSAGAACSSGKVSASHVLRAQGVSEELARAAIRVSWGWASRRSDLLKLAKAWSGLRRRLDRAA